MIMNEVVRPQTIIVLVWDLVIFIPRHISSILAAVLSWKHLHLSRNSITMMGNPPLLNVWVCFIFQWHFLVKRCGGGGGGRLKQQHFLMTTLLASNPVCLQATVSWSVTFVCCYCLSQGLCLRVCLFLSPLVAQPKQSHSLGNYHIQGALLSHSSTDLDLKEECNTSPRKPKIRN